MRVALEIERRKYGIVAVRDRTSPRDLGLGRGRRHGGVDGDLVRLAKVFLGRNQGEVELDRAEGLVEGIVEERGVMWAGRK